MPCSCDRRGMWDRRVSIGQTSNANSGLSILEPLMELIIEHCTGKCNHSISNEMVRELKGNEKLWPGLIYGRNVKGFRIPYANDTMKGLRKKNSGKVETNKKELFTHKEEMYLETAQTTSMQKFPILKQVAQTTTNADGTSTSLIPGPVTNEENAQKKNDVNARNLNLKFLRSLPFEWNTHVVVWRNKPDLDTMSFDDLYNNFKIVEQEIKGTASLSSSSSSQNMAFVSSPNSTNEVNTAYGLALLSMRTRRFFQKTGRKITINGSDTAGYDKNRNQDNSRRTVNVEETSSKAMLAIDGAGFDLSYIADDEVPTNMALMAFLDSKFNKSKFNLANYKRRLASVEEQLVCYKKNELEKLKQEKESNQLKIENFDNASKSLDKLIGSQIPDKSRKGLGLEEFQQPEFEGYGPKPSKSVYEDTSNKVKESPDAPIANCNYHKKERLVSGNNYTRVNYNYSAKKTHPSAQRNMVPRAVLIKTGLRSLNTARPVNTVHPKTIVYSARPMSHFKEFDGGYVTFGGEAKGGKITSKGTLKTDKLDFEDVYFVKELQFNLFSVSQMCDKKNSVLFIDTGCFVVSPDFKLADESQVLLKVFRKNNMDNVDMKNIVPKESLTCLVAKATLDESML
ncbi:hypothetical protein Tco_0630559 [Tanacetum coccineum]